MVVGDLIEVPEIKTVIQLKDKEKLELRQMILDSFIVTAEVRQNLEKIFNSLIKPTGSGAFLKGHFGSGKSHFLSILSLLLRYPPAWQVILEQDPSLKNFQELLVPKKLLVAEISLVQHRATEFLEDIFQQEIFRELARHVTPSEVGQASRKETFAEIQKQILGSGFTGLVLLVDELSEFLRSKTDAHAFQEDIRFLQFLGEEAPSFPLWIVASLQEWIEETGDINQDTFNKIKDRYPIRLNLGRAHIEELISHRLIRQKKGAGEEIKKIFQSLRGYFPSFPVDEARFIKLYPVHPATIALLDRLKILFSEHRGVVDFIHSRLKGDQERGIPSLLDKPATTLLGPATIFDHFLHRLREMAETQPYIEKGYEYFSEEIPRIFKDPDQQKVALEAVKILILAAISPVKVKYSVKHLTEMVLFRVTELDTEFNYQYFHDLLERLAKETSFLVVERGPEPKQDHFALDLRLDLPSLLRRKIRQVATEIFPNDRRLFTRLLPWAESTLIPLAGWAEKGQQNVFVSWEYSTRNGLILLRQIDELPWGELEKLAADWQRSENDFYLIVGTTLNVPQQLAHLRQDLLPKVQEKFPGIFLFWIPAALPETEEKGLKEILATLLLADKYQEESSPGQIKALEFLQSQLQSNRRRLGEIFTEAYFHGLLLDDEHQIELANYGYLTQEKFLEEFIRPLLSRRFPKHNRVLAYLEALPPFAIPNLIREFFATGLVEINDRTKFGLRTILEDLLKPMGLIKKKGNQYFLHVDPRTNELAASFFSLLDKGIQSLEDLYWVLRKGEYGLLRTQFDIMVLALIFSGNLIPYQGSRKKSLEDIARQGLAGITSLGKGEILSAELREVIPVHPLIPENFRRGTFTLPYQEALWNELKGRKEFEVDTLRNLQQKILWASSFQAFKNIPWDSFRQDAEDILAQWAEVKVSLPAKEGLEKFLAALAREPFLAAKLSRLEKIKKFFDYQERILFVYQYINDARLVIPAEPKYAYLSSEKEALQDFFIKEIISIDLEKIKELLQRFHNFRENYIQAYAEAHRRNCSGEQFAPYERVRQSRRYQILSKLAQIEIVSVLHQRQAIDQSLFNILKRQCPALSLEALQRNPTCACGFTLGESIALPSLREIEEAIDQGIKETMETLASPPYQEKILPYLHGLEAIGEGDKSQAIRQFLALSSSQRNFLEEIERVLTNQVIEGINEAFRGKVVIVERNLDQLYKALLHRKYTITQVRKIFQEWLRTEELAESTFIHFTGQGYLEDRSLNKQTFLSLLEDEFPHLLSLLPQWGPQTFQKVILLSLWREENKICPQEVFPLFPFLQKEGTEKGELLLQEFSRAAQSLRQKAPNLFFSLAKEVETQEGFLEEIWHILRNKPINEIFQQENIFPAVLKEAFAKLIAILPEKKEEAFLGGEIIGENINPEPLAQMRVEMVEILKNYQLFAQKWQVLKRRDAHPPQGFTNWQSFYIDHLSPFAYFLKILPEKVQRMEINLSANERKKLRQGEEIIASFSQNFADFYQKSLPLWETGQEKRPLFIEDLPALNPWKRRTLEGKRKVYILLDGLRWDLWVYLKENFFKGLSDQVRIISEGVIWTHLPSSTPRQMEFFTEARRRTSASTAQAEDFWHLEGIDERVHTEKGGLEYLFRNILQYLQLALTPRLQELPAQTYLLFFSDHGFIENPHFSADDKYRSSRYLHGEASPFEVIVPWAAAIKI
ncbi:MAG: DUF6079 family protein [bacterium]